MYAHVSCIKMIFYLIGSITSDLWQNKAELIPIKRGNVLQRTSYSIPKCVEDSEHTVYSVNLAFDKKVDIFWYQIQVQLTTTEWQTRSLSLGKECCENAQQQK